MEAQEGTGAPPTRNTERLPHLPQGGFYPPGLFFYYFIPSHLGEEFLLYNYQPAAARGTKPGRSDESLSAAKKGALQSLPRS